uniref:Uncharacterized protein n=1 Tax=Plectus sambesii TaxID=2011161 RepID=A0A914XAJ3_9BILA
MTIFVITNDEGPSEPIGAESQCHRRSCFISIEEGDKEGLNMGVKEWFFKPVTWAGVICLVSSLSSVNQTYYGTPSIKLNELTRSYSTAVNRAVTSGELGEFVKHGFEPKMDSLESFTSMSTAMFLFDFLSTQVATVLLAVFLFMDKHDFNIATRIVILIVLLVLVLLHSACWINRDFGSGQEAGDDVAKLMLGGVGMMCSRPEHCRVCQKTVEVITARLDCSTFKVQDVDNRPYEYDPFEDPSTCKSPSTSTSVSGFTYRKLQLN